MTPPSVSLVVTTFNHERYIDEALASIGAQTTRDFEVVIMDDASSDGTVERIQAWLPNAPVAASLTVNERNLGLCATRNRAIASCRGEFVCSLAGDDAYEPPKIARQLECFRTAGPSVGAVFSDAFMMTEDGDVIGRWFRGQRRFAQGRIFEALLARNFIPAPTVMVRRSVLLEVGGYDESLFIDDRDMWLKIADRYEFRYVDEPLVRYRLTPTGMSLNPAYELQRREARVRTLLKWHGRARGSDAVIERLSWAHARRAFAADPERGRELLGQVCRTAPSWRRRLVLAATRVPGISRPLARLLRWRDARKRDAKTGIRPSGS